MLFKYNHNVLKIALKNVGFKHILNTIVGGAFYQIMTLHYLYRVSGITSLMEACRNGRGVELLSRQLPEQHFHSVVQSHDRYH